SRALRKACRDIVLGFRGEFEHPPDLVALPRDCSEVETVLSWAEAEGAAVVPFNSNTSVYGCEGEGVRGGGGGGGAVGPPQQKAPGRGGGGGGGGGPRAPPPPPPRRRR